jgi:hypothetical protein
VELITKISSIMRKPIVLNVLVFAIALSFNSCKDDEPTLSVKDYLTGFKWKSKSITIDPPYDWYHTGTQITDVLAELEECKKDDLLSFEDNGILCKESNEIKCGENEDEKDCSDTYTVLQDAKILHRDALIYGSNIKVINNKQLILETYFNDNLVTYILLEEYEAVIKK